jgi:putative endonuclease
MRLLGAEGEAEAVRYLKKKGYRVIERNYRTPLGEIDIIARDEDILVFIEVKTRASDCYGLPFEAVDRVKRRKIRNLALLYLKRQKREVQARFDVISITQLPDGRREIDHIEDAFEV